jgi:hypothetical protein
MQDWHSTCLGRRLLPRDLSAFEIEAFFNFSDTERRVIEDRRSPALKLALALQIGFLRMTGRLLDAVRIVPPALWRHLGEQLGVVAPDLASLRSMYQRRRTENEFAGVGQRACLFFRCVISMAAPCGRADFWRPQSTKPDRRQNGEMPFEVPVPLHRWVRHSR